MMRQAFRGRPAINDSETLQRLALLIRRTPDIKTTTALRMLDILDPSEVRRLRDKHRKFRRVVPGKSAPHLDKVYLTGLFDRLKGKFYPAAEIYFRADGIAMFGGKSAQTLHIPGRASSLWVKTVFVPRVTRFLRRVRDHHILEAIDADLSIDDIGSAFGMTPNRVHQIRRRGDRAD